MGGEIRIAPELVGICGTDLEILDGKIDPAFVSYPIVIGHEWAGTVVDGNDAIPPGTRVVVEGVVPCRICESCILGDTNRCDRYDEFGFTRDGAAADTVMVPPSLVHVLADGVAWESAVLVEPASVVYRALSRVAPRRGARVLVVGDGTIGMITARMVRLWEPATVTMLGARPEQCPLAVEAGVDWFATDAAAIGGGFDLVVEAAGDVGATSAALAAAGRGGVVVLVGFVGPGVSVPLSVDELINNDVTVTASFSYTSAAWAAVVALVNSGALDLSFLITHRFSLEEFDQAFETLRHPTGTRGKVVLDVRRVGATA